MRVSQAQVFVHLQVKLDKELTALLECCDVVNSQTHALRDGTNGFKQVLALWSAGFGVHHDVGRHDFADAFLYGIAEDMYLFEAGGTRHADRGIDEMAVASAPDAHAINGQDAIHSSD